MALQCLWLWEKAKHIKREESLLVKDINVVKRKTKQKQVTGLAEQQNYLEEIFQVGGKVSKTTLDLSHVFKETIIEETSKYRLVQRNFCKELCEEELIWHRDKEDRDVCLIEGDGWYIQKDNELPQLMKKESIFKIPKETWHRIINKNGTNLIINVRKYK